MAKVKILNFEIASLLSESKKIMEYLQKCGCVEFKNTEDEALVKYKTSAIVSQYERKYKKAFDAYGILENYCEIKRNFIEAYNDCKDIEYSDYKILADKSDDILSLCDKILAMQDDIVALEQEIAKQQTMLDYYKPWLGLDIAMGAKRTAQTNIYIGTFLQQYSKEELLARLKEINEELDCVEIEVEHSEKMLTCVVFICHQSVSSSLEDALKELNFIIPEKLAPTFPEKAIEACAENIKQAKQQIDLIVCEIKNLNTEYDNIRFFSDYLMAQIDKYKAVENAASTENAFYIRGYITEKESDDLKFEIENNFVAQMEICEPDYEHDNVPVLLKNTDLPQVLRVLQICIRLYQTRISIRIR